MHFVDYLGCDGTFLAAHVAAGDVMPAELLDLALGQAQRINPYINDLTGTPSMSVPLC